MTTNLHAHIDIQSADCDGRYDRSLTITPDEGQDDHQFQAMVLGLYLPLDYRTDTVTVEFDGNGFRFSEPTDEGYRAVEVVWCEENDTDRPNTQRDHSAEAAGY